MMVDVEVGNLLRGGRGGRIDAVEPEGASREVVVDRLRGESAGCNEVRREADLVRLEEVMERLRREEDEGLREVNVVVEGDGGTRRVLGEAVESPTVVRRFGVPETVRRGGGAVEVGREREVLAEFAPFPSSRDGGLALDGSSFSSIIDLEMDCESCERCKGVVAGLRGAREEVGGRMELD